jgi:D-xylose transport system substrate-binding protein
VSIRRAAAILPIMAIVLGACAGPGASGTGDCKVGVAWATFQEERYGLRDEPGIKAALEGKAEYVSNDAKNTNETQAANVEALIAANVDVLVLNSVDPEAILPSVEKAVDAGIPLIAYDRELENEAALFMTHDNVEVGRMIARAVTEAQPTGNYAIIKGQQGETNPEFLREGMQEILQPFLDSGDIVIPEGAEVYTDNWKAEVAQVSMEQILTDNDNDIQALLSENDNMATGAVAALAAQGLEGEVKIGGQDGDKAALNRVALGTQVVSVWKDATELGTKAGEAALQLCADPDVSKVTGAVASKTTGGLDAHSVLLAPIPITQENLQVVLDAEWLTEAELCDGVPAGSVTGCP